VKLYIFFLVFIFSVSYSNSQVTLIPDPNFEQFLIFEEIDTDGIVNGQVLTSDIEDELSLSINYPGITDLTGLQDFTALTTLSLLNLGITEINLTENSNLESLDIEQTSLTALDVSQNLNLIYFLFAGSGVDFQSPISSIDLSNNLNLSIATFYNAEITEIDLSNNQGVIHFEATGLDQLNQINLKNGNNLILDFVNITNNSKLVCVQVDDPEGVIAGNPPYDDWVIDNNPVISENCFLGYDEASMPKLILAPNPTSGITRVEGSQTFESLKVYSSLGQEIKISFTPNQEIDLQNFPSGIYIIEVITAEGDSWLERVIKF